MSHNFAYFNSCVSVFDGTKLANGKSCNTEMVIQSASDGFYFLPKSSNWQAPKHNSGKNERPHKTDKNETLKRHTSLSKTSDTLMD